MSTNSDMRWLAGTHVYGVSAPPAAIPSGQTSSSSSNKHQELGLVGILNAYDDEENQRLKREIEITRRLLLIKNSNPNGVLE